MNRFILFVAIILSFNSYAQLTPPQSPFPPPEFMNVKIEGGMNEMIEKYKAKGFAVVSKDETYLSMTGKMNGNTIELNMAFTPKSKLVWKLLVYLPKNSDWYYLKKEYQDYKDLLTEKYGTPSDDFHFFLSPYKEGDGYEITAVQVDKCRYTAFWEKEGLSIEISKFKQVKIGYENLTNSALLTKEKKETGLKDL